MTYEHDTSTSLQSSQQWGLRAHVLSYIALNLVQILIWWNTTPDQFFWPAYSIVGWGVGLAFHAWFVAGAAKRNAAVPRPR